MPEQNVFTREFHVDKCERPLLLYQQEVGDVSCVVWDAALVLASYLQKIVTENEISFKSRKVLELGSGVGCVGLTAACLGADSVMTDLPEVIPLIERNISANKDLWHSKGKASAISLNWEIEEMSIETPDFLLLADCVYYSESVPHLVNTMRKVCDIDTTVFICQEKRSSDKQKSIWTHFIDTLCQHFTLREIPTSEQHQLFSSTDIVLFKCKLKHT